MTPEFESFPFFVQDTGGPISGTTHKELRLFLYDFEIRSNLPLNLSLPNGKYDKFQARKATIEERTSLLQRWMQSDTNLSDSEKTYARSLLTQAVVRDMLSVMLLEKQIAYGKITSFIEFSPFYKVPGGGKESEAGLILIEKSPDGSFAPLALIDVTTQRMTESNIHRRTHGIFYDLMVPILAYPVGSLNFRQEGINYKMKGYMDKIVKPAILDRSYHAFVGISDKDTDTSQHRYTELMINHMIKSITFAKEQIRKDNTLDDLQKLRMRYKLEMVEKLFEDAHVIHQSDIEQE